MSWIYRGLIRPALFSQESEWIHDWTLRGLAFASRSRLLRRMLAALYSAPPLPMSVFGLRFPNPVGLAAGMDKHAEAVPIWESLGFGFSELGGVTQHAQPGNDAPRMFRVVSERALINRMGFNNPGAAQLAARLQQWRSSSQWPGHPVGINLGKSKITPIEAAVEDYVASFRQLRDLADFFVINVSSPNTPNLRKLQDRNALDEILVGLNASQAEAEIKRPFLVKVAPDLSFDALDEILELVEVRGLAGIVATNTTLSRPPSPDPRVMRSYEEAGGLSGQPLRARSTDIIRHLHRQSAGRVPIIGVGGIFTAADAWEKVTAGAALLQVYTGMVYEGPGVTRAIVRGLRQRLQAEGLSELKAAVGIASGV